MSIFTVLSLVYALSFNPQVEQIREGLSYNRLEEKVLTAMGVQVIDLELTVIYSSMGKIEHPQEKWPKNNTAIPNNTYVNAVRTNRYAQPELVDMLVSAAGEMFETYQIDGVGPRLQVNDASRKYGGRLSPHVSHRRGIDADIGMYRFEEGRYTNRIGPIKQWNQETLEANWNFLKSLQHNYSIQYVFWNGRYINKMKNYVLSHYGEAEWNEYGKVFHTEDHHTSHFHIRIVNPSIIKRKQREAHQPCC